MSSMHINLCVLTVCLRGNIIIIMIKFMICKWIIIIYDSLRIYEFWIGKQLSVSVYVKCHILVKVCVFFSLLCFGKIKCVQINFENLFGLFDLPIVWEKNARFSVCVCGLCCLANIKKKKMISAKPDRASVIARNLTIFRFDEIHSMFAHLRIDTHINYTFLARCDANCYNTQYKFSAK